MDPSASSAQSAPNQSMAANKLQQPVPVQAGTMSQQSAPTPQPISVHPEQGPVQTATPSESTEDEIVQPAQQEVSVKPVQQTAEVDAIEMKPSTPEVSVEQSVEQVIEKSPDMDRPKLSNDLKAIGVTHSGPGVPVDTNNWNVKSLPMTFEQAVAEEKQHPRLNDSKHWLAELVLYVWRKIDPTYGKQKGAKQENKFWKFLN